MTHWAEEMSGGDLAKDRASWGPADVPCLHYVDAAGARARVRAVTS